MSSSSYDLIRRSYFFFQAEDGIRDYKVTGVQTCALPICLEDVLGEHVGDEVLEVQRRGLEVQALGRRRQGHAQAMARPQQESPELPPPWKAERRPALAKQTSVRRGPATQPARRRHAPFRGD